MKSAQRESESRPTITMTAEPHERALAPGDDMYCPICSAQCDARQCKVICPRCHVVVMNCSEF